MVNDSVTIVSTIGRISGFPKRVFVCPSNSGSGTLTDTTAVNPSRTNSPGIFGAPSFSLPVYNNNNKI